MSNKEETIKQIADKVKPKLIRIARMEESESFYTLEEKRNNVIKACASEWIDFIMAYQKTYRHHSTHRAKPDLWKEAIPQALFDTLESFEIASSVIAAIAFLEYHGFKVE